MGKGKALLKQYERSSLVLLLWVIFALVVACQPISASPSTRTEVVSSIEVEGIRAVPVATGFFWPTDIAHAGDARLFVTEKRGRILVVQEDGTVNRTPFLDIQDRVVSGGFEQGLLGLAFHPRYTENGYFYVSYTRYYGEGDQRNGDTAVSRFQVTDDSNVADPTSETVILEVDQPTEFHNGGDLAFGPDGYLYITRGEGGSTGPPSNTAQDKQTLLGKILRVDVNRAEGDRPYAIPPDNPFANDPAARSEIWAYGLRNPWRISFDRGTGDLYFVDVGAQDREEVNFQPVTSVGGENYGWPILEGSGCFPPDGTDCDSDNIVLPVHDYEHESGGSAIIGGFVYRGTRYPEMQGYYFFIDYYWGKLWTLRREGEEQWSRQEWTAIPIPITTFGEGADGELYLAGDDWTEENLGILYQIESVRADEGSELVP